MSSPRHSKVALFTGLCLALGGCGRIGIELIPWPETGTGSGSGDGGSGRPDAGGGDDDGGADGGVVEDGAVPDAAMCSADSEDTDGDGMPDCIDLCNGVDDADYVPDATCGVGYCQTNNTPSACVAGVETACKPGAPRSATDATCDGVDDNCSGAADEGYARDSSCGVGYCRTTNTPSQCMSGSVVACVPGSPLASNDTTLDGVDDDCDGAIDEDACTARTQTFGPGVHALAPGGCRTLTVKLWGGGGAAGNGSGGSWLNVTGGDGGAGGFAQSTVTLSATAVVSLDVGQGGRGCGATLTSTAAFRGGAGGKTTGQAGTNGADGTVAGGNGGTTNSRGGKGGNGSYGGGGGGSGARLYTSNFGPGGDGGSATVLIVDGTRSVVAGGGGGGGGAGESGISSGVSGSNGGTGCSGVGAAGTGSDVPSGGGGGGGQCVGTTRNGGMNRTPYNPNSELGAGAAVGADRTAGDCAVGGNGYAIVTYAP